MGLVDDVLPWTFFDFMQNAFQTLGMVLLISAVNPWLFFFTVPLFFACVFLRAYFLKTSRQVKRIEAAQRSPIYSHLSETLSGLVTIRSHGAQGAFINQVHRSRTAIFLVLVANSKFSFSCIICKTCTAAPSCFL